MEIAHEDIGSTVNDTITKLDIIFMPTSYIRMMTREFEGEKQHGPVHPIDKITGYGWATAWEGLRLSGYALAYHVIQEYSGLF